MNATIKLIDNKQFYCKTLEKQGYIILFRRDVAIKNDKDYDKICDDVIKIIQKRGTNLFVSDIIQEMTCSVQIRSILEETLFVYIDTNSPIVASGIVYGENMLSYESKCIASIVLSRPIPYKMYFVALSILIILFVGYRLISDKIISYRHEKNLAAYQHDYRVLDSLSNYLESATGTTDYQTYSKYIPSATYKSIEYKIDSLRQCADSCFNTTSKGESAYISPQIDKVSIKQSIQQMKIDAKALEKEALEQARISRNNENYIHNLNSINSLRIYLNEKTSNTSDYCKYIDHAQVLAIQQILDSLSSLAKQNLTAVEQSGAYLAISIDSIAIEKEINRIVKLAQERQSAEKKKKKPSTTIVNKKNTPTKPSGPKRTPSGTNPKIKDKTSSHLESEFLRYKQEGNSAYMRYYQNGNESDRLKAIASYKKALDIKSNDTEIAKKISQLNK